ncbi:MAG TPA: hypothetical protein VF627_01815 [Abditibacterium sp.]|jgi:hypothetical protein
MRHEHRLVSPEYQGKIPPEICPSLGIDLGHPGQRVAPAVESTAELVVRSSGSYEVFKRAPQQGLNRSAGNPSQQA